MPLVVLVIVIKVVKPCGSVNNQSNLAEVGHCGAERGGAWIALNKDGNDSKESNGSGAHQQLPAVRLVNSLFKS